MGFIDTQYEEHDVITGIPDTSMPMDTNRMKWFLVLKNNVSLLCDKRFVTFLKATPVCLLSDHKIKDYFKIGNVIEFFYCCANLRSEIHIPTITKDPNVDFLPYFEGQLSLAFQNYKI